LKQHTKWKKNGDKMRVTMWLHSQV
jgi:hypothetical protein